MIINIPIESLQERYSEQWNKWIPEQFDNEGVDFGTIYPEPLDNKINIGSFLDVIGTNYFKAQQLSMICKLFAENKVKNGDTFFFHDLWFPGLEMLFYIRNGTGIKFKIMGMLHAGSYDKYDFLNQTGMTKWAKKIEESWFNEVDKIFVATQFHKDLISSERGSWLFSKIHVTGFPLFLDLPWLISDKEDIVVFPHRLNSEKQPELFDKLAEYFKDKYDWKFIKTKEVCKTKQEYYDILRKSKVAVSFAQQETWGIAQQEALFSGCIPVVPNRLSYKEMYDNKFKYSTFEECRDLVEEYMKYYIAGIQLKEFKTNYEALQNNNRQSIRNMIQLFHT